jgi:hypothetical protein
LLFGAATPKTAAHSLSFASEVGDIYVVQTGPRFELVAKNSMGDVCMATPAISGQLLIVRTKSAVYAIEK